MVKKDVDLRLVLAEDTEQDVDGLSQFWRRDVIEVCLRRFAEKF